VVIREKDPIIGYVTQDRFHIFIIEGGYQLAKQLREVHTGHVDSLVFDNVRLTEILSAADLSDDQTRMTHMANRAQLNDDNDNDDDNDDVPLVEVADEQSDEPTIASLMQRMDHLEHLLVRALGNA